MTQLKAELSRMKEHTEKADKKGVDVKIFPPTLLALISALEVAMDIIDSADRIAGGDCYCGREVGHKCLACEISVGKHKITKLIVGNSNE